jgi:predicted O-linked N-acetylglucosamine transferase (SPINDLY family)
MAGKVREDQRLSNRRILVSILKPIHYGTDRLRQACFETPFCAECPSESVHMSNDPAKNEQTSQLDTCLTLAGHYHVNGQLREAETLYRQILAVDPNHLITLKNLGILLSNSNRLDDAADLLEQASRLDATNVSLATTVGSLLIQLERYEEATSPFLRAIAICPNASDAHLNLGVAWLRAGIPRRALRSLRRAVALSPNQSKTHYYLGRCLQATNSLDEAEICYRRAIEHKADLADAWMYLGILQLERGNIAKAIDDCRRASELAPNQATAFTSLGNALNAAGQREEACAIYCRAIKLDFIQEEANKNFANLLQSLWNSNKLRNIVEFYHYARQLNHKYRRYLFKGMNDVTRYEIDDNKPETMDETRVRAIFFFSDILEDIGRGNEAEQCATAHLNAPMAGALYHNLLGLFYGRSGILNKAVAAHDRAAALDPDNVVYRSNQIFMRLLEPDMTNHRLFEFTRTAEFNSNRMIQTRHLTKKPDKEKTLRIGYVLDLLLYSDNIYKYLMGPIVHFLNTEKFEVFIYGDSERGVEESLIKMFPKIRAWRNTYGLTRDQAHDLIQSDDIDILVNLVGRGYFIEDRTLSFFYSRPAPIQVTLGASMTTGLDAIDYFIADPWLVPRTGTEQFSERVVRIPHVFAFPPNFCLAPPVARPPMLHCGRMSFGFFGSTCKLNDEVIALWSEVLTAVENSQLLIRGGFSSETARRYQLDRFSRHGIDESRIKLLPRTFEYFDYLQGYNEIDLSLDPFPYCGGQTTLESLWMGVPMLTLPGERCVGRMSLSILGTMGLEAFAARSKQDYIDIAVKISRNPAQLATLRNTLRETMRTSRLTNAPGFAHNIERTWRALWRRWCEQQCTDTDAP